MAAAGQLREQDVGDQVAAEGEEDPDPEQPSGSPAEPEVKGEHGEDGDGSQPVQPGHVALAALDGFRHGDPVATLPAWTHSKTADSGAGRKAKRTTGLEPATSGATVVGDRDQRFHA